MDEYNKISVSAQNGCPGTYYNHEITEYFTRSNCGAGYQGGDASYTVPANKYSSPMSQAAADAKAEVELLTSGPANANINGSCSLIYYNAAISETDVSQNCPAGYKGGNVTYTVPAQRYSSIISQADADRKVMAYLIVSGQRYANAHGSCVRDALFTLKRKYPLSTPTYCNIMDASVTVSQTVQFPASNTSPPVSVTLPPGQ